jgi:putative nucleotidyltransferase with HDIG domain
MQIPSQEECFQLVLNMEMLENIVAHSFRVCQVATFIADELIEMDVVVNRELVRVAALLHDITKTRSIKTGEPHAATGGQVLRERGYPEVGFIIEQHVVLNECRSDAPVNEAEIVNYADKRVLHDQVVPLQNRLAYILERYGRNEERRERIRFMWEQTEQLETKLFRRLEMTPAALENVQWDHALLDDFTRFRQAFNAA